MRRFTSIAQFVEFLGTRPAATDAGRRRGLEAAGELMVRNAQAMIGEELPDWADLAPSTVEEKQRLGFTGRVSPTDPLLRTGELRASIMANVGERRVTIGSDDPVALYQELGTSRIPPRSFIGSTVFRDAHEAADLIANHELGAAVGMPGTLKPVQRRDGDAG